MRKSVLAILSIMLLLYPLITFAHFLGYSAVDGREIRWEGSTKYNDAKNHSINIWNALRKVTIAPDDWWTASDLILKDVNRCDVTWGAQYSHYAIGTDDIAYNICKMDAVNDFNKRKIAAHEMGHALGLNHSFNGQVMCATTLCIGNVNTPQSHDIADYNGIYP